MLAIAIKLYLDLFYKLNYIPVNIFFQVYIQYVKGKIFQNFTQSICDLII